MYFCDVPEQIDYEFNNDEGTNLKYHIFLIPIAFYIFQNTRQTVYIKYSLSKPRIYFFKRVVEAQGFFFSKGKYPETSVGEKLDISASTLAFIT
jgi:hypothetical protein